MDHTILVERNEGVVTVVLNRPDKLNAMTKPMWGRLGEVFRELDADDDIKVIVMRGAGERSFSPGNDIAEFETDRSNAEQAAAYGQLMHGTIAAIRACRHPSVAMIHGICVGGGLEIAGLMDVRIAGRSSRFGAPIARLGLVMAYPELTCLNDLVGPTVALEILLEGRIFDAGDALRYGIVSRVVDDDAVETEALETAARIAAGAPLVHRWHKKFLKRLQDPTPLTQDEEAEGFDCYDTVDFQTGYKAFLAKETPAFKGR